TLTHPPNSPNLNPIKPLWLLLKNQVADILGSRHSIEDLWAAIQTMWKGILDNKVAKV
ncbi:hypothetical protein BC834DRAFT_788540, partial [Gloeopeniophorella convolvens]